MNIPVSISLFQHNQTAYKSALDMMSETGKAVVIHPTGTGKSFIGFKLAEEHPNERICWLSPSEYIFKTQIENLKAAGAGEPQNIEFYTYAKLMLMSGEEIAGIQPDYIILDEFHRCGAEQWGKGVQKLLDIYDEALLLGLSATNIRYLDNQRDMADELFDGNIASEMTLGEAIVRNILLPPTYVISVYSYQKDLEKYQQRVRRAKSKAVRDAAQEYLDALRRALEKADGLDVVFQKHIRDKSGKYIVFCSNIEHLNEMIERVPEWFSGVDKELHVYKAYSDDPETSKSFMDFKSDTSSHLKLLFCIDMLNEGIHVDDISGVILFRPTVSPIIYKQQIGRALSASKTKEPIIFDIVNNFAGIYSIGTIQDEMQSAISYYRSFVDSDPIVNERFKIIDEVRDCKELFDSLHETLSASWDLLYQAAALYYAENSSLNVPKRYRTADNLTLGSWIDTQRRVKAGKSAGILTQHRIDKLDSIGMQWEGQSELSWNKNYTAAQAYFTEHQNLKIPIDFISPDGITLGRWIANIRQQKASNIRSYLTEERECQLNALNMIWDKISYLWEQNYLACANYFIKHGNLEIPAGYVSEDGLRIGVWVRRIRRIRSGIIKNTSPLSESQIERLDLIGFNWSDKFTQQWEYGYEQAMKYHEQMGSIDVPVTYISKNGFPLGKWLRKHVDIDPKTGKTSIRVTPERRDKLSSLGMVWISEDQWDKRIRLCQDYYKANGNLNISQKYVADGVWLGKWVYLQRKIYCRELPGETLTPEQVKQLENVGIDWLTPGEHAWENNYSAAQIYFSEHQNLDVPKNYRGCNGLLLAVWLLRQRKAFEEGKLTETQIKKLNNLGYRLNPDDTWECNYRTLLKYVAEHGNAEIPAAYVTDDGVRLGKWLAYQINQYNGKNQYGSLSREQIKKLESIGVIWSKEDLWQQALTRAQSYYLEHGNLDIPNPFKCEDGFDIGYWVYAQRKLFKGQTKRKQLTKVQIEQLSSIGMAWLSKTEQNWEQYFSAAEQFYTENGHLRVPVTYKTGNGLWLGRWVTNQREKQQTGKLTSEQVTRLAAINMTALADDTSEITVIKTLSKSQSVVDLYE